MKTGKANVTPIVKSACFLAMVLCGLSSPLHAVEIAACAQLAENDESLGPELPRWRFPVVKPEVMDGLARSNGGNPLVAIADFDGDSKRDVALLIQTRVGGMKIAVCLSSLPSKVLYISDLYCDDGIAATKKGTRYYDWESGKKGRYNRDGISAYCWEQAGATYLFEKGAFRRVIDSD